MEADGLRWSLLIIGSLVIVGLAVHGIWLSRKNSEKKAKTSKHKNDQEYQPSGWQSDEDSFDEHLNYENKDANEDLDIKFDMGDEEVTSDQADEDSTTNEFDDLGVGTVRVVTSAEKVDAEAEHTPATNTPVESEAASSKIYASVVTQPKPEYAAKYNTLTAERVPVSQQENATSNHGDISPKVVSPPFSGTSNHSPKDNYQVPEPPPFLLKKEASEPESEEITAARVLAEKPTKANHHAAAVQKESEDKPSLSEQSRNLVNLKKADSIKKRREPRIAEDQMRIDFDEQPTPVPEPKEELKTKPVASEQPQEVLVLNVKSADDNPIPGSALLPMLLTLGFKFGDQDIFHRHVNSNGKGPVLFSLANMFKPGNFDIDNLENFTTQGISLFMILPIEGEPHQVFNMMHNAARKIAEEFSAQIYDGRRTLLTKQSLQQYVEKIREFERQRSLRG